MKRIIAFFIFRVQKAQLVLNLLIKAAVGSEEKTAACRRVNRVNHEWSVFAHCY